jgi:hypothetical protein
MRARVGASTLHQRMLDRNAVAGHGCCRWAGPSTRPGRARKSARAWPGCSAAAQRSPFRTSHLLPVQEWVRKGSGAREPLYWISQQQAADKINSAEDDRVRAGRIRSMIMPTAHISPGRKSLLIIVPMSLL